MIAGITAGLLASGGGTPTDPDFGNLAILAHFTSEPNDGSYFGKVIDTSANHATAATVVHVVPSNAESKFGSTSAHFPEGGGSFIGFGSPADTQITGIGTGDFTIEAWCWFSSTGSVRYHCIYSHRYDNGGAVPPGHGGIAFYRDKTTGFIQGNRALAAVTVQGATACAADSWHHVAWSRTAGVSSLFVDGVLDVSVADTQAYLDGSATIGSDGRGDDYEGFMNDLRITVGVGRYTAIFAPPTAPFPDS